MHQSKNYPVHYYVFGRTAKNSKVEVITSLLNKHPTSVRHANMVRRERWVPRAHPPPPPVLTLVVSEHLQRGNLPLKLAICYEAPLVVVRRLYDEYPAAIDAIDKVSNRGQPLWLHRKHGSHRGRVTHECVWTPEVQWGENVLHAAVACNPNLDVLKFLVETKPELARQANKVSTCTVAARHWSAC